jgi:putative transposase
MLTNKGISERQSCELVGIKRNTHRHALALTKNETKLKQHIQQLAQDKPRYGYRRLTLLIRKEGILVNHKRIYRIYKELNLAVRAKKRRRLKSLARGSITHLTTAANQIWSMDYQTDQLATGRRFRCLNLIDNHTRECLAIEAGISMPASSIVATLSKLKLLRGLPKKIIVDNGPEFRSKTMQGWALNNHIELHFIDPGKPTQNALIESFNGRLRDECLNLHWFTDIKDVRQILSGWKNDYNLLRPHSSLGNQVPSEFAALVKKNKKIKNTIKIKNGVHNSKSRVS